MDRRRLAHDHRRWFVVGGLSIKPAHDCIPRKTDDTPAIYLDLCNQCGIHYTELLRQFFRALSCSQPLAQSLGQRREARDVRKKRGSVCAVWQCFAVR